MVAMMEAATAEAAQCSHIVAGAVRAGVEHERIARLDAASRVALLFCSRVVLRCGERPPRATVKVIGIRRVDQLIQELENPRGVVVRGDRDAFRHIERHSTWHPDV